MTVQFYRYQPSEVCIVFAGCGCSLRSAIIRNDISGRISIDTHLHICGRISIYDEREQLDRTGDQVSVGYYLRMGFPDRPIFYARYIKSDR